VGPDTTGCLTILIALITVLGVLVSWLWYRHWHDGNGNSERRDRAFASILKQAHARAGDTDRALETSGITDVDALTGVIWRHTEAPVIAYDASRHEFTAMAASSAHYDAKAILPGGGSGQVTRCFVFTFTHRPGQAWTSRVSERDDDVCRAGTAIGGLVRLAQTRISSMYAEDLTRAGVQKALDPTGTAAFLRRQERGAQGRHGDRLHPALQPGHNGRSVLPLHPARPRRQRTGFRHRGSHVLVLTLRP
jgi:hypothetical protein